MIGHPAAGHAVAYGSAMDHKADRLGLDALCGVLDPSHLFQPDQLADAVDAAVSRLGMQTTIYLIDDEQRALHAVPQGDREVPDRFGVDDSVPGRVFCVVETMPAANGGGWWVPMVN